MSDERELHPVSETGHPDASAIDSSHDQDSDEEFQYPGAEPLDHPLADTTPAAVTTTAHEVHDDATTQVAEEDDGSDEEFRYPGAETPPAPASPAIQPEPVITPAFEPRIVSQEPSMLESLPPRVQLGPSSAQLESVAKAAAAGDLEELQSLFRNIIEETGCESFVLANDHAPRTGLTALHHAASRGYLPIVQWLVENCGAMTDLEDKEGETALHKASLNGHINVIKYLLSVEVEKADVHVQDADGWTALHNACSKGYLDIVRYLCESAGAADIPPHDAEAGIRGVDRKSKGGWTPLMNAASKGHLPVVRYLLTKQNADPLVRNNWGETAYDAAAAVFEIWICEVLQKAEEEKWASSPVKYNPLAIHTAVPLIIHENQRLDARIKTLAVSGGRPKFSASGLGRRGRRSPFELRMPPTDSEAATDVPAWRTDVNLPFLESPFALPKPRTSAVREGAERSHFWLSDWTLDLTHPKVNPEDGWQYARALDEPDDRWTAEVPAQLERLLSGSRVVPSFGGGSGTSSPGSGSHPATSWARRRRWVRVMRRRLDIPPLPFMQPDGKMYHLSEDGILIPVSEEFVTSPMGESDGGQELGSMPTSFLSSSKDYVARARYLAGSQRSSSDSFSAGTSRPTPADVRRTINKLERAVNELRTGMLGDDDIERRTQAEVLLNTYSRELERTRLSASAEGLLNFNEAAIEEEDEEEAYSSDESFHYPSQSPAASVRAPSVRSHPTDYFDIPTTPRTPSSRRPTDLTPQLSQAPDFRVPTHEMPQKVRTPTWTPPTPHQLHAQWEPDDRVSECRSCKRRFTFYFRKHVRIQAQHCRRCGRIFCDRCSSRRAALDPADVVHDPSYHEIPGHGSSLHRVCESCYEQTTAAVPSPLLRGGSRTMEGIVISQSSLAVPSHNRDDGSQISDLAE
ncbi:hypothetical protein FRB90_007454 [Tulasnella sp. 427]|nr:hypothetical protein FRB90_007454 [Tulasnella sp. 427]